MLLLTGGLPHRWGGRQDRDCSSAVLTISVVIGVLPSKTLLYCTHIQGNLLKHPIGGIGLHNVNVRILRGVRRVATLNQPQDRI